ncbi:hypothetical protein ES705_36012 [subsurface metagenome]
MKRDVDEAKKFEVSHEVNIDEDKKDLIKGIEINANKGLNSVKSARKLVVFRKNGKKKRII